MLLLLLSFLSFNIQAQEYEETARFTYQSTNKLATYISSSSFRQAGDTSLLRTYTIETAGNYILTEPIASNVGSDMQSIITINADNVTLDLGGNTLSQSSVTDPIHGILIKADKKNITIKNGRIKDCTGGGIVTDSGCYHLLYENIWVTDCGGSSMSFIGGSGTEISNIRLNDCYIINTTGSSSVDSIGLRLHYCCDTVLTNCHFNLGTNTTSGRSVYGTYITQNKSLTFTNCSANKNHGNLLSYGFYIVTSSSVYMNNCEALYNVSDADSDSAYAVGFYLNQTSQSILESCISASNTAVRNTRGFYIYNSSNNYFYDCLSLNNSSTNGSNGNTCTGFYIVNTSSTNQFYSCKSNGNKAAGTLCHCYGFDVGDGTGNKCVFNYFSGCDAVGNRGYNSAAGIILRTDSNLTVVLNGNYSQNSAETTSGSFGYLDQNSGSTGNTSQGLTQLANTDYP